MHRIDGPGATQDNRFTDGDPTAGIPPTIVTDDWANAVQEELSGVIEGAGLTLDKAKHDQLKAAITKMITDRAAPLATTEQAGLVERATDAEAQAGTDGERYVTPKQLKDAVGTTDLTALIRDMRAGDIVMRGHTTIRTLDDGLPEALELNGDVVNLATFPRLMRVWWGASLNATAPAFYRCNAAGTRDAAGTHLKLPDLRGYAPRGWDHGRGIDAGRVLLALQEDAIRNITGTLNPGQIHTRITSGQAGAFYSDGANYGEAETSGYAAGGRVFFDASRVVPTATENRMRNAALMFIIYI